MKHLLTSIRGSTFAGHILTLFTGTFLAQLVPFLVAPVLARLYDPADFGILSLFMSAIAIFGVIAGLRYEFAIVLPARHEEARQVLNLSLVVAVAMALLSLLLVLFLGDAMVRLFDAEPLRPFLGFLPLAILLTGIYQSFNYWSTRHRTFRRNAAARIAQSMSIGLVSLILGLFGLGALGLISGYLLGLLVAAAVLAWVFVRHPLPWLKAFNRGEMRQQMKRYKSFAFVNSPHALIDSLLDNGIVFVISIAFGNIVLGWYSWAFRALKVPVSMIGSAVGQVFFERAATINRENQSVRPLMWRIHRNMAAVASPVFLLILLFGPDIFAFVFSEDFRESGKIAQVLLPWIFLNYLISPFSNLPILNNKQPQALAVTLIDLVMRTLALLYGWYVDSFIVGFTLMAIASAILSLLVLGWYYRLASKPVPDAYA